MAFRSSLVVKKMGSTDFIRKGSMIVFMHGVLTVVILMVGKINCRRMKIREGSSGRFINNIFPDVHIKKPAPKVEEAGLVNYDFSQ